MTLLPRIATALAIGFPLAAGLVGCGGPDRNANRAAVREGKAPLNLVVITLDTTRADRLGCYGYERGHTPSIDALAASGVVFENATASVPLTVPSHASIFTGTMPPWHGVRTNEGKLLDEPNECLAEMLGERGYATGAFLAAAVLDRGCGLMQGFDTYSDDFAASRSNSALAYAEKPAETVVRDAIGWIRSNAGGPFFAWVHLFDPHAPYEPRSARDVPRLTNPYDAEIAYSDWWIGELVRSLEHAGVRDETLVVLVSDHGEGLGDHDEDTHGFFLYETTMRVPLVISCPALLAPGTRVAPTVRTIDILPTFLDLIGAPALDDIQGVSLVPWIDGEISESLPAYAETYYPQTAFGWSPLLSLREESWKVILAPRPELYDLGADPDELSNRYEGEAERAARMLDTLDDTVREYRRSGVAAARELDAESRAMLAKLGYIAESANREDVESTAADALDRPDPKDGVQTLRDLGRASRLVSSRQLDDAKDLLNQILEREPRCTSAYYLLGEVLVQREEFREAERHYERLLRFRSEDEVGLINLASVYRTLDRPREAATFLRRAVKTYPTNADALIMLADLEQNVMRNKAKAREYYERFLEVAPSDPMAPRVRRILSDL